MMSKRLIVVLHVVVLGLSLAPVVHAQTAGEVVLRAAAAKIVNGAWMVSPDATASGSAALWLPDAGVPKLAAPSAAPRDYFELSFVAHAGVPYRLWIRGRAQNDSWTNDSVFVQ